MSNISNPGGGGGGSGGGENLSDTLVLGPTTGAASGIFFSTGDDAVFSSTSEILFSSTANPFGIKDTGMVRSAAGVMSITNGAGGNGALAIGSVGSVAAAGDFGASDGTRSVFFDASIGRFSLTDTSASDIHMRVGGSTSAVGYGDVSFGDATREAFWDASSGSWLISDGTGSSYMTAGGDIFGTDGTNSLTFDASAASLRITDNVTPPHDAGASLIVELDSSLSYAWYSSANTTASLGSQIILAHKRGTHASYSNLLSGDVLGSLLFLGGNDSGSVSTSFIVRGYAAANWSATSSPAYGSFFTNPAGTNTSVEHMRISAEGGVSIGNVATHGSAAAGDLVVGDGTRLLFFDASAGRLSVETTANEASFLRTDVSNAGTGAQAIWQALVDSQSRSMTLRAFSSSFTPSGFYLPSLVIFEANSMTNGMTLRVNEAAPIRLVTTDVEHFRVSPVGGITVGDVGTYGNAAGVGDIISGDGTRRMFYDASINTLGFTGSAVTITGNTLDLTLGARSATYALNDASNTSLSTTNQTIIGSINEVNTAISSVNDLRLTLETAVPVSTSGQTAKTMLYLTPYKGNNISLYNGTSWTVFNTAEVSIALGTLVDATNYDVWAYDSSGTVTLELLAWTNDTTRATAIVRQDGVWCKTGALTRRLVGTIRTTSTTTTEDSNSKRFVCNIYNRVTRSLELIDTTTSWTYTTATWRQARATASNKVEVVVSINEVVVKIDVNWALANTASLSAAAGVGLDSTTVNSAVVIGGSNTAGTGGGINGVAKFNDFVGVGYHYLAWLEISDANGTTTWFGDASALHHHGITGEIQA